jgi:hypothetical protein
LGEEKYKEKSQSPNPGEIFLEYYIHIFAIFISDIIINIKPNNFIRGLGQTRLRYLLEQSVKMTDEPDPGNAGGGSEVSVNQSTTLPTGWFSVCWCLLIIRGCRKKAGGLEEGGWVTIQSSNPLIFQPFIIYVTHRYFC